MLCGVPQDVLRSTDAASTAVIDTKATSLASSPQRFDARSERDTGGLVLASPVRCARTLLLLARVNTLSGVAWMPHTP